MEAIVKKLKLGDKINVMTEDLPRVVEMIPAKGKEGSADFVPAHEGEISKIELTKPIECEVVAFGGVGKNVGIQLPLAPKGHRWYDAHECDGKATRGFGWWISFEDVAQANPELAE